MRYKIQQSDIDELLAIMKLDPDKDLLTQAAAAITNIYNWVMGMQVKYDGDFDSFYTETMPLLKIHCPHIYEGLKDFEYQKSN